MNRQSHGFMLVRSLLILVVLLTWLGTALQIVSALSYALSSNEKGAGSSLTVAAILFSLGVFALAIIQGIPILLAIERNTWLALSEDVRKKIIDTPPEKGYDDQVFK
jgi:hypothetical protein